MSGAHQAVSRGRGEVIDGLGNGNRNEVRTIDRLERDGAAFDGRAANRNRLDLAVVVREFPSNR